MAVGLALAVGTVGCGSKDEKPAKPPPKASPADFPSAKGKNILQLRKQLGSSGPVLAPSVSVLEPGTNRFGFGLFDAARAQIADAAAAVYVAPVKGGAPVLGPFPARFESLIVDKRFQSRTTASDPDSARSIYVSDVKFPKPGKYAVLGVRKLDDRVTGTGLAGVTVVKKSPIPAVGDRAPRTNTPTKASVGNHLEQIDTRTPHDDMHETNFASELGKKPQILIFATPALCQSKVCGPVVDVAEQVKTEGAGKLANFVHMEVYEDNDPNKGYRPQLKQWHLRTEPWLFAVNRKGIITTRIEGAFSPRELKAAVRSAQR